MVVADEPIDYPKTTGLDLLLALNQESLDRYLKNLKAGGTLIVDPFRVKNTPSGKFKVYSLPITELAKKELGKVIFGNIISLGAIAAVTGVIEKELLEKTVLSYVPEMTRDLNKKALEIGFRAGSEAK